MKPKQIFWSGLKGGLFEDKHYRAMGEAVWLFGWLTTRQTAVNDTGEGIVNYGNPMTRDQIARDTGYSVRNVKFWTARLIVTGYVRTSPLGKLGNVFFIRNGKNKAKNPKPPTKYFPADLKPDGQYSVRQDDPPGQFNVRIRTAKCPANFPNPLQNEGVPPIANTLTSKQLNYNKASLAKDARFSLSVLAKAKSIPRGKGQCELDERRRFLLRQSEEMALKYPPKVKPVEVSA